MDLTRDPRNGRNFEYLGEDPLLAGILAGEEVRGTQDQHVIATLKHFALNANETNRTTLDARIERAALRESDLLAFEIAVERGHPGSVMCAYNRVNSDYACGNHWLLIDVLKTDWHYPGWVMSDWGAVHGVGDAANGLDQESGAQLDALEYFGMPLKTAVLGGAIPIARLDDMVHRILHSMFAVGIVDHPSVKEDIDYAAHGKQFYLTSAAGERVLRLIGFQRIELEPGERSTVTLNADRRLLGWFDEEHRRWQVKRGSYQVRIGKSAGELLIGGDAVIAAFNENLWH